MADAQYPFPEAGVGANKKLHDNGDGTFSEVVYVANGGSGAGGSGGPITLTDGADAAQGSTSDAPYAGAGSSTIVAILKGLYNRLGSLALSASSAVIGKVGLQVNGADVSSGNAIPVAGAVTSTPLDGLVATGSAIEQPGVWKIMILDLGYFWRSI